MKSDFLKLGKDIQMSAGPITIRVRGFGLPLKKLADLQFSHPLGIDSGIYRTQNTIKDMASLSLTASTESSKSFPRPYHSINENWEITGVTVEGNDRVAYVYNKSPHAEFVEFGTAARREANAPGGPPLDYVITPRHSKKLHFYMYGWEYYTDYVKGQYPKAYFRTGIEFGKDVFMKNVAEGIWRGIK